MAQTLFQDGGTDPLSVAIQRLDKAVSTLERKVAARTEAQDVALRDALQEAHDAQGEDLFDNDRARLAAELEAAHARERALEEIAAEASAALGRAAAEVRAALSAEES